MSYHSTVLTQILKIVPRHEFDNLSLQHDGKRRQGAFSRCAQFVSMLTCQLFGINSTATHDASPSDNLRSGHCLDRAPLSAIRNKSATDH